MPNYTFDGDPADDAATLVITSTDEEDEVIFSATRTGWELRIPLYRQEMYQLRNDIARFHGLEFG